MEWRCTEPNSVDSGCWKRSSPPRCGCKGKAFVLHRLHFLGRLQCRICFRECGYRSVVKATGCERRRMSKHEVRLNRIVRMRLARTGSTVGTRLIVRETVAIDTLANRATSTGVILLVIGSDTANEYHLSNRGIVHRFSQQMLICCPSYDVERADANFAMDDVWRGSGTGAGGSSEDRTALIWARLCCWSGF